MMRSVYADKSLTSTLQVYDEDAQMIWLLFHTDNGSNSKTKGRMLKILEPRIRVRLSMS